MAHAWQREALQVELLGAYGGESFGAAGEGVWLGPRAVLRVPAGAGVLSLRLWAPRPTPPLTRLRVENGEGVGPLDVAQLPGEFSIEIAAMDPVDGRVEFEIASVPYVPAAAGADDGRELGVVLSRLDLRARCRRTLTDRREAPRMDGSRHAAPAARSNS